MIEVNHDDELLIRAILKEFLDRNQSEFFKKNPNNPYWVTVDDLYDHHRVGYLLCQIASVQEGFKKGERPLSFEIFSSCVTIAHIIRKNPYYGGDSRDLWTTLLGQLITRAMGRLYVDFLYKDYKRDDFLDYVRMYDRMEWVTEVYFANPPCCMQIQHGKIIDIRKWPPTVCATKP